MKPTRYNWPMRRAYAPEVKMDAPDILANPDMLDRLIDWKLGSVTHRKRKSNRMTAIHEGAIMQRQFTIELRVDYEDADKNDTMRTACQAAARHVYATATLLADGVKPQIAIYADDFFSSQQEIALLDDTIQQGIDASGLSDEAPVSSELMKAVRDS